MKSLDSPQPAAPQPFQTPHLHAQYRAGLIGTDLILLVLLPLFGAMTLLSRIAILRRS